MKKTNRTFKRFAAITSASLLAACMVAPMAGGFTSSALTNGFTMSVPSGIEASEIKNIRAYKIFDCEIVNNAFNVNEWATGVTPQMLGFAENTTATDAAKAINAEGYDEDALAKKAATAFTGDGITGTLSEGIVTFASDLGTGYYLVVCDVERDDKDGNANATTYDAKSLGMLTVTGRGSDTNIGLGTAKVGLPQVEKKVKENVKNVDGEPINDKNTTEKWNDVADYNIGDPVPFKLYGTMPTNYDKYDAYYYKFSDTLADQFNMPTVLNITIDNVKKYTATYDPASNPAEWTIASSTDSDLTGISVTSTGNDFAVEFKDIKGQQGAENIVTIEYSAVLNSAANIGETGQENAVKLEYSNNPNEEYIPYAGDEDTPTGDIPEKGETPEDKVKVHTYAVRLDKEFYNAAGNKLTPDELESGTYESARFSLTKVVENGDGTTTDVPLYFQDYTDDDGTDDKYDYILVDATNMSETEKENARLLSLKEIAGEDGKIGGSGTDEAKAEREDNELVIRIKGLDDGTYKLKEEVVPSGFNPAPEQTIKITANTVNDQNWEGTVADKTLTSFSWTINPDTDSASTVNQGVDANGNAYKDDKNQDIAITAEALAKMLNNQGTSLPGTGGIGTTIFYLGGGAMAAIGGIYLISKRRMKKSEE